MLAQPHPLAHRAGISPPPFVFCAGTRLRFRRRLPCQLECVDTADRSLDLGFVTEPAFGPGLRDHMANITLAGRNDELPVWSRRGQRLRARGSCCMEAVDAYSVLLGSSCDIALGDSSRAPTILRSEQLS